MTNQPTDDWDELDEEEDLFERAFYEGVTVAENDWDSGGPGAGAGVVTVRRFEGKYFGLDDVMTYGPFDSLWEACRSAAILFNSEATRRIVVAGRCLLEQTGNEVQPLLLLAHDGRCGWADGREKCLSFQIDCDRLIVLDDRLGAFEAIEVLRYDGSASLHPYQVLVADEDTVQLFDPLQAPLELSVSCGQITGSLPSEYEYSFVLEKIETG